MLAASVAATAIILSAYKDGPAAGGETVTGAPFNFNRTCTRCHGGGNFGGSILTELLDANGTAVTEYVPGMPYTMRITLNHTTGNPKHGFQTTAATVTGSVNLNNWGTPPAQTHSVVVSGRTYLEHSTPLTNNVILLPFTAPAAGTGSIIFYTAGNIVNGNNSPVGDQPVNTSLTITEGSLLPVTIAYFKGVVEHNAAVLTWATLQEMNNKNFVVEKSYNGTDFTAIAEVASKGNNGGGNTYAYTDNNFHLAAFYRLVQVDLDGKRTMYSVVDLKAAAAILYDLSVYGHAGASYIRFYNGGATQKVMITYTDMQGRRIYTNNAVALQGYSIWPVTNVPSNGIFIVSVIMEDGTRVTRKFISTR